mmetsp:Transcript_42449/g.98999  ORF Transcript_42449/g.98999 Transcript_42449/m.98999 type:complete len:313 (-) Transcript_42449:649-1587(-)
MDGQEDHRDGQVQNGVVIAGEVVDPEPAHCLLRIVLAHLRMGANDQLSQVVGHEAENGLKDEGRQERGGHGVIQELVAQGVLHHVGLHHLVPAREVRELLATVAPPTGCHKLVESRPCSEEEVHHQLQDHGHEVEAQVCLLLVLGVPEMQILGDFVAEKVDDLVGNDGDEHQKPSVQTVGLPGLGVGERQDVARVGVLQDVHDQEDHGRQLEDRAEAAVREVPAPASEGGPAHGVRLGFRRLQGQLPLSQAKTAGTGHGFVPCKLGREDDETGTRASQLQEQLPHLLWLLVVIPLAQSFALHHHEKALQYPP